MMAQLNLLLRCNVFFSRFEGRRRRRISAEPIPKPQKFIKSLYSSVYSLPFFSSFSVLSKISKSRQPKKGSGGRYLQVPLAALALLPLDSISGTEILFSSVSCHCPYTWRDLPLCHGEEHHLVTFRAKFSCTPRRGRSSTAHKMMRNTESIGLFPRKDGLL